MLREISGVRQENDRFKKRWFTDDEWDLFTWTDEHGEIRRFQLCYDKGGYERAFTWEAGGFRAHNSVNPGDDNPTKGQTPILLVNGSFDSVGVAEQFRGVAKQIDPTVRTFVYDRVHDFTMGDSGPDPIYGSAKPSRR